MELVRHYPEVLDALRDGRLCVTVIHALSKAITPENRTQVLPRFFHVSELEAKVISAEIAPAVEVARKAVVTAVRPGPALDLGHKGQPVGASAEREPRPARMEKPALPDLPPSALSPRSTVEALTAQDRRLHLTVTPEFLKLLDACKDALSHTLPGADDATILQEGMRPITANDLRVCCDPHDQEHARQVHGEACMDRFRRRAERGRRGPPFRMG